MAKSEVVKVLQYRAPYEADQYLQSLAAKFYGKDRMSGAPVFKTAAGIYIRASGGGTVLEVLSHCTC